ncbi:MAG: alpha/beta fold hydrolase [Gemmatimonadaceae bacterium]
MYARRSVERIPTPWVESGHALTLEMVVYKPLGAGPYPTLIFHHGSTGAGDKPELFTQTYWSETIAKVFVDQGWQVLFPQRRGRGTSDGLYDEGFEPDRSRYSCRQQYALPGLVHALDDAEVILTDVRARADVDPSRLLVGGVSRGGILAMAHAAQHPDEYVGVVIFVGGWLGEACVDAVPVNRSTFVSAATLPRPSLWLYGQNDTFYSIDHSQANFDAFVAAGGKGAFEVYRRSDPTANGHGIANEPSLWRDDLLAYLGQLAR